jgi:hypothetical protein
LSLGEGTEKQQRKGSQIHHSGDCTAQILRYGTAPLAS